MKPLLLAAFACASLVACTTAPQPHASADSVLAAQYRARGAQGAMSGEEAGHVTDAYVQKIGAIPASTATDTTDNH